MPDKIADRVRLFNIVRDIPFYIAVGNETDYCCATKPIILDILFKSIKLRCRHVICDFKWESSPLPKAILKLPHEALETHEYLEVWIPERKRWVIVDPSWDARIRHHGFHINRWDGLHDTKIAVRSERIWTLKESAALIAQELKPGEREKYLKRNRAFFVAFNRWLDAQRRPI